jgi:two-component system, cell cycle sensor histidine kinase and response regulator CckA
VDGVCRTFLSTKGPIFDDDGEVSGLFGISRDITKRKWDEETREATIELLRVCNEAGSERELMRELTGFFHRLTGCEAVGVRLRECDDFPYYETHGFPEEFVLLENSLCARDQKGELIRDYTGHPAYDCMCGNVLSGRFDPSKPFFTRRGSFWSSCTTDLLATTSDADRQAKTRNRCNGEGYESVALVPLRSRGETLGLFQFNDRRKGRFSAEKIAIYEELVAYVAIALAKLKAEEELQETSQRLQLAVSSGQLGIWDWNIINNILVWNDRMFELYGLSQDGFRMSLAAWEKCLHPDDLAMAVEETRRALNSEKECNLEFRIMHPDGSIKYLKSNALVIRDENGSAVRMTGINQDVTEQKSMEEQLRQSQKMEAIGQLAGGVAHDFNNILTAIYGYCSVLQMKVGMDAAFRPEIDHIYAAAERAANLTKSLLAFSRKQLMTPRAVNLNDIIMNLGKFLTRIIGEDIHFKTLLTGKPLTIFADSGQIEQVLMNLAANARDAMPEGGLLTIGTESLELDECFVHAHGYGAPGKYAVISISDTGKGMDAMTAKKIFEPFFTTKEVGKGTGLGLAIVYGVVKQHNGFVNVYSEPESGTTFRVYLPHVSAEIRVDEVENALDFSPMGDETVLVAEDDTLIRELVESILRKSGYRVISAFDGMDAIEKFKANLEKVDIIIMDMVMPKMSGREAYGEIRKLRPDVKLLFISGYSPDLLHSRGFLDTGEEVLIKPFPPQELVRKVRAMLDSRMKDSGIMESSRE